LKDVLDKISECKRKKGRGLLLSFYEHNEDRRIPRLIRAMKLGLKVGLVSDAGTPTISDPGFAFMKEARANGIVVEALPGPCAAITALSAAGFPSDSFAFYGYLPKSASDKLRILSEVRGQAKTVVFYESPNRLLRSLHAIEEVYGADHEVYVGMELTKMHEKHYRAKVGQLRLEVEREFEGTTIKGEVTVVIGPGPKEEKMLD